MTCEYVLCWRITDRGDGCSDPVLLRATDGLVSKLCAATGTYSPERVRREWAEGRAVRTRLAVYDPVAQARVPAWLDSLEDA